MGFIWVEEKKDDEKFISHMETKINDATTTLNNTNQGLLSDIVKLKKDKKEKEGFEVDEFNRLKTENEQLKNKQKEGESEAEKQLRIAREQHSTETKDLKDRLDKRDKKDEENLIKSEASESLSIANVKPSLMKAAIKVITSDITMENGVPMIGDKTISEHIKEWSKTDEGKNFVLAKKNNGGDSKGGDDQGDGNEDQYFNPESGKINITKQVLLKKSNPDLYNSLVEKYK